MAPQAVNPFYVHPGGDIGAGLAGLGQQIGQFAKTRREFEQEKTAKAQDIALRQEASDVLQRGDTDEIQKFLVQNPSVAKDVDSAYQFKSKITEENAISTAWDIVTGKKETVQALTERAQVVDAEGGDASDTIRLALQEQQNPQANAARKEAELLLMRKDPEAWDRYQKSIAPEEGEKPTASQKDYRLAKKEGFKGTFVDYKQAVTGAGPKTKLEMMKLEAQLVDITDRREDRKAKKESIKVMADKKTKNLVSGIDSILEEAGKAITEAKESITATGIAGAVTAAIPGSPAYNLQRRVETLKANLGFDKLQSMRDASPTGGALGQVSERELTLLTSALTSLDPNMGEDRLIEALEKVQRHYNTWRDTLTGKIPEGDESEGVSARVQYTEGQTATGAGGQKMIFRNGNWEAM